MSEADVFDDRLWERARGPEARRRAQQVALDVLAARVGVHIRAVLGAFEAMAKGVKR